MTDRQKWDIAFEIQTRLLPVDPQALRTVVEAVMRRYRERQAAITITVVDDAHMKKMHARFLKQTTTTDVLSFDLTDAFERRRVFEIIVNAEMAVRQARRHGHAPEAELALYIVHGLLHNLGFDDDTPERAHRMHRTEDAVLEKLGFGSVYADGKHDYGKE